MKMWTIPAAAALTLAVGAQSQALGQATQVHNGSFEEYDTFFNAPVGWKNFTNPGELYRRLDDGMGPILVRTGEASIELASGNNFAAWTTDIFDDCLGRTNNPRLVYDTSSGNMVGPDCTVSGWYAIPSNQFLMGANAGLKLEFRRANNSIFGAYEALTINGHTNSQWVYFELTVTTAQLNDIYLEFPTEPVSVSVLPLRFGAQSAVGTIFWDDIVFKQGCAADINKDGFVDGIDSDTFNNMFEAGNIGADYNGDCFVDGIDSDTFNNDFESGGC